MDTLAPAVSNIVPTGTITTNATNITAAYSDSGSSIDASSVVVKLDGSPLSGCTAGGVGVSCPVSGLGQGSHTSSVSVRDGAGNTGTGSASFIISTGGIASTNVKDYGAAGDGIADDTGEIQAAINSAPAGSIVYFPTGTYKVSNKLNVNKSLHLISDQGATIKQTSRHTRALLISGLGPIEVKGLHITGANYLERDWAYENAIEVRGDFASGYFAGVTISDCVIDNWGGIGIDIYYSTNVNITNNTINNVNYAGIETWSIKDALVEGNIVDNVVGPPDAYGIIFDQEWDYGLPVPKNIVANNNRISNVKNWSGLDAHGVVDGIFSNNTVTDCFDGIVSNDTSNPDLPNQTSSHNINITGNHLERIKSDGIRITGAPDDSSDGDRPGFWLDLSTGSIKNNTIIDSGDQGNSDTGSITLWNTSGVEVSGNTIINPAPNGITLRYNNFNLQVANNSVTDVWSNQMQAIGAIAKSGGYNTGTLYTPFMTRGSKTANYVNTKAVYVEPISTNTVVVIP